MRHQIIRIIEKAAGGKVTGFSAMGGGCVADVQRLDMEDGRILVAKIADEGVSGIEGAMLRYLADNSSLPVPDVLYADDKLLLMNYIATSDVITAEVQTDAANLVADLHQITSKKFGFAYDTVIGGLHQPNPWDDNWIDFFCHQRLLYMGNQALNGGKLPARTMKRLEALAANLDRWLDGQSTPSLIHGDMWTGNVLCHQGRISGFVDPAIYYADGEIELAFSTLFGTFGDAFFKRYHELRPIKPGFFEERRDLYNLYPLLVHVCLFGGHYVGSVERTLSRFGF